MSNTTVETTSMIAAKRSTTRAMPRGADHPPEFATRWPCSSTRMSTMMETTTVTDKAAMVTRRCSSRRIPTSIDRAAPKIGTTTGMARSGVLIVAGFPLPQTHWYPGRRHQLVPQGRRARCDGQPCDLQGRLQPCRRG